MQPDPYNLRGLREHVQIDDEKRRIGEQWAAIRATEIQQSVRDGELERREMELADGWDALNAERERIRRERDTAWSITLALGVALLVTLALTGGRG